MRGRSIKKGRHRRQSLPRPLSAVLSVLHYFSSFPCALLIARSCSVFFFPPPLLPFFFFSAFSFFSISFTNIFSSSSSPLLLYFPARLQYLASDERPRPISTHHKHQSFPDCPARRALHPFLVEANEQVLLFSYSISSVFLLFSSYFPLFLLFRSLSSCLVHFDYFFDRRPLAHSQILFTSKSPHQWTAPLLRREQFPPSPSERAGRLPERERENTRTTCIDSKVTESARQNGIKPLPRPVLDLFGSQHLFHALARRFTCSFQPHPLVDLQSTQQNSPSFFTPSDK